MKTAVSCSIVSTHNTHPGPALGNTLYIINKRPALALEIHPEGSEALLDSSPLVYFQTNQEMGGPVAYLSTFLFSYLVAKSFVGGEFHLRSLMLN